MFLDPGRSGGPETYLRELVSAMAARSDGLEIEIATTRRGAKALRADGFADIAKIHELPADEGERVARLHAEQIAVPRLARERGWHVIHSLANTGPLRAPVPHVLTLHDVIFFRHRTLARVSTFGLRPLVRQAARRASLILTVSESSRTEIIETLGIPEDRIVVAPSGPGRSPAPAAPEAEVRERFGLAHARLVLSVGAIRPHKNQQLLVEALHDLPGFVLVLAGDPEAKLGSPPHERVQVVGYVPDRELEALWQIADCAAFATLAEGFGLPVLEAMRRGVPVACSDLPVLREVGGDVPHYFDPRDAAAAAAAIQAAAGDPDAREAGPAQARHFTWERAAAMTVAAYERVLSRTPHTIPTPSAPR
jgi:glycosyltransferase involved in cell wall biosynthesis